MPRTYAADTEVLYEIAAARCSVRRALRRYNRPWGHTRQRQADVVWARRWLDACLAWYTWETGRDLSSLAL